MKTKLIAVAGVCATLAFPFLGLVAHAQMSTSTLGSAIDTVNGTTYDFFTVLLAKYWPFVVGFGVLLIAWGFGRRILAHFS